MRTTHRKCNSHTIDHSPFPPGFFARTDPSPDAAFYSFERFVTHIDDTAIAAVSALYDRLILDRHDDVSVLDLCSSWISHFSRQPARLAALGMNEAELAANPMATDRVVADLNLDPTLPYDDAVFDAVTCCVSVDYLTRPLDVFAEVARVLRPDGVFACTFSNRCFPTKAISGWLSTDDHGRCAIVATYFAETPGFGPPEANLENPSSPGDPLFAVWALRAPLRPVTTHST
ncbi:MAG: class I SAM-dependent methyltransferase [Actinomycetota bacterium]